MVKATLAADRVMCFVVGWEIKVFDMSKTFVSGTAYILLSACLNCSSFGGIAEEPVSLSVSKHRSMSSLEKNKNDASGLYYDAEKELLESGESFNEVVFHGEPLLAFVKDGAMWIADVSGTNPKRVLEKFLSRAKDGKEDGYISPDGISITYILNGGEQENSKFGPSRYISIARIGRGENTVFKQIPEKNSISPKWSPDGDMLTFSVYHKSKWLLARISQKGSDYKRFSQECYSYSWSTQGIYCDSGTGMLYLINPDSGEVSKKWGWTKIFGDLKKGMNSLMTIVANRDGSKLLLVIRKYDPALPPDGPGVAFVFDTESKTIKQITSTKYNVGGVAWLPDEKGIVFSGEKLRMKDIRSKGFYRIKKSNLYRINLDGTGLKMIVKGADSPSISRGR